MIDLSKIDDKMGGVTRAMLEGAQAWKDRVIMNPYRSDPNSKAYHDWNHGWDESQNYFEWQESLSDGTLQENL